ncbi:unnamed protein product [Clonostachys chloroleuca]|uniref:Uncharacterized protein n=1 Tax=Clonostachys chloroleuca TaxID=1926264 RepID=A0AA35VKA0_9HYPO|nr:unnamed protein product [Clonostachys chloroleuca]
MTTFKDGKRKLNQCVAQCNALTYLVRQWRAKSYKNSDPRPRIKYMVLVVAVMSDKWRDGLVLKLCSGKSLRSVERV